MTYNFSYKNEEMVKYLYKKVSSIKRDIIIEFTIICVGIIIGMYIGYNRGSAILEIIMLSMAIILTLIVILIEFSRILLIGCYKKVIKELVGGKEFNLIIDFDKMIIPLPPSGSLTGFFSMKIEPTIYKLSKIKQVFLCIHQKSSQLINMDLILVYNDESLVKTIIHGFYFKEPIERIADELKTHKIKIKKIISPIKSEWLDFFSIYNGNIPAFIQISDFGH